MRKARVSGRRLERLEARLRRIGTTEGPPPEWMRGEWQRLVADGLAATAEVRHQRWLLEQWRELALDDA